MHSVHHVAQAQHGIQAMLLGAFVFFAALRGRHHLAQFDDILQAVDHPGVGRLAIAPGATGFLVVGLHGLGHIQVRDEAHVRFVDAHAKGDGGDDDHRSSRRKRAWCSARMSARRPAW